MQHLSRIKIAQPALDKVGPLPTAVEKKPISRRHISRETGTVATRPLESAEEVVKFLLGAAAN